MIDLPKHQVDLLAKIGAARNLSRDALVRAAIDDFLAAYRKKVSDTAFGLWGGSTMDSVDYQRKLRDEWSAESRVLAVSGLL
jgi:hypothetical protein